MKIDDYFPKIRITYTIYSAKVGFTVQVSTASTLIDLPDFNINQFVTGMITLRDKDMHIFRRSRMESKHMILAGCGYTVKVKTNGDFKNALKLLLKKISKTAPYVSNLI